MKNFAGKTAVVTGGASGIGLAIAERFASEGMKLVLADIEPAALDDAVGRLSAEGYDVEGVVTDVAKYSDVEALAARAVERFGNIHVLCNNAGVSITGPIWEFTIDDWRWVWDVNVWGVVNGVKAFLPDMMAHGDEAHVVNTGSLASFASIGNHAPYCASKAAVLGFSSSLYSEMKALATKVGVSILCPGMVDTLIHQSWRNRPEGDVPWSDREFADAAFRAASDEFQGAGIAPEAVADAVIDAIRDDQFYIFTNPGSLRYLDGTAGRACRQENPFVVTWGEDRRPEAERGLAPWLDQLPEPWRPLI